MQEHLFMMRHLIMKVRMLNAIPWEMFMEESDLYTAKPVPSSCLELVNMGL